MNDSLSNLGSSLAGTYYNELAEWSSRELVTTTDDFSASFALADDILRFEEGWLSFGEFLQSLQYDLIPQDLLAVANDPEPAIEQEHLPSGSANHADPYPFTSQVVSAFKTLTGEMPRVIDEKGTGNKDPNLSSSGARGANPGSSQIQPVLSPNFNQNQAAFRAPGNSLLPEADHLPGDAVGQIPEPTGELPGVPRNRGLPSPDHFNDGTAESSPENWLPETPALPGLSSGSIWSRPLNNLGDLAGMIVPGDAEKDGKAASPGTLQVPLPGASFESTRPGDQPEREISQLPGSLIVPAGSQSFVAMANPPAKPEYLPLTPLMPEFIPELPGFELEKAGNIPDTDDILDALTERILRDFRRYYP